MTAFVALLTFGCGPSSGARTAESQAPPEATAQQEADLPPRLPPLQKEDVLEGEGPEAKRGDRVLVHYTGTLMDGTKFDSSLDRGKPFEFAIGAGHVIAGWELGVVGMKKGGKRTLVLPPHLAYGSIGSPPKIPPDATLRFEIELLEILA
jgi:FKBP-type peptidyl-prolyl cis-trans isomerase